MGRAKIAAALVLTSPFVPMLFQGEEFGASSPFLYFTDYDDPELGRLISEGRKKEFVAFGWSPDQIPDPQAEQTFTSSKLNWSELTEEPHRLAAAVAQGSDQFAAQPERTIGREPERRSGAIRRRGAVAGAGTRQSPHRLQPGEAPVEVEIGSGAECCWPPMTPLLLSGANVKLGPDSVAVVSVS